jgi:hypothetical protein
MLEKQVYVACWISLSGINYGKCKLKTWWNIVSVWVIDSEGAKQLQILFNKITYLDNDPKYN